MKKLLLLVVAALIAFGLSAQHELHIHHINIENGDATLIGIYDAAQQTYVSKILIDGGQLSPETKLLPYIKKMVGSDKESFHFEYVILTHYHNDHYNGLLALGDGRITADSIVDPGGYRVNSFFKHSAIAAPSPDSLKKALPWLNALKKGARHVPDPFIRGRSKVMIRFGANSKSSIGNKIIIGSIGNNHVELQCIAGWGNTLSESGHIIANASPKKSSANNFTLAFILSYGEFRYFIGGDMGGDASGSYIDQEAAVTKFLNDEFPSSNAIDGSSHFKGHVCGFKANHHGSQHSNTANFLKAMHPAIAVTSAGNNKGWHLPHPKYLERLADLKPVSEHSMGTDSISNRGIYITNLYDFTGFPSKTKANSLFQNKPGISYDFGNITSQDKGGYLIKIKDETAIQGKSVFEVGRVDVNKSVPYKRLAGFVCHVK